MKKIGISILKILITLITLGGLLVLLNISFNSFSRMFINNNDYYIITNSISKYYSVIISLIVAFLVFLLLFKEQAEIYNKKIFKKANVIIFIVLVIISYFTVLFNMNVVYDDYIVSYNIFNLDGKKYDYEDIESVDVYLKKHLNTTVDLYYKINFKNKSFEIFNSSIDFGLELEEFDYIMELDDKFKKLDIDINRSNKYLDKYLTKYIPKIKMKVNKLFE